MTSLLLKLFVKDYKNTENSTVREKYGVFTGLVGIVVNIIIASAKLLIGTFSGSISITADAVNNFSDAGSSVITLIGFKMANKPADTDHPYGHGRIEYISGMIVAFIVLIFGVELMKSSVERIINPVEITYNVWAIVVLALSIVFVAITDLFVLPNQCQYIITIPCYTFYCLGNIFKNSITPHRQSTLKHAFICLFRFI